MGPGSNPLSFKACCIAITCARDPVVDRRDPSRPAALSVSSFLRAIFVLAVSDQSLISACASVPALFALCSTLSVVASAITYVGAAAAATAANTTTPNILERCIVLALPLGNG